MRKTIKLITLVITMLLLSTIALADSNIIVKINNNQVNFNRLHNGQPVGKPFIENNRTYLPIRVISEDLGYKVDWKQASQTAIITKGKTKVEIKIGESTALVNGVRKNIDNQGGGNTKAKMVGGRTYVPVRFISEAMGDKVEYRNPSNSSVKIPTVYINCTNLPVETPVTPKPPVVKPNPTGLVPEFHISPHNMSGAMDYTIWLKNFKEYEGTGAKFSPALVSHPQYNSYVVRGNVQKDENKMSANKEPLYYQSTFRLKMWSIDSEYKDINTGKSLTPPKVGEIMKWHITIDMGGKPSEVYEIEIPYRNFTKPIVTSGTRIK